MEGFLGWVTGLMLDLLSWVVGVRASEVGRGVPSVGDGLCFGVDEISDDLH
jgi:hypothetical protein